MFLLINYCFDMFRLQFLAIFRELIILCSLYVNFDIQAAQTHALPEDGQGLRPKHVGAIIKQKKIVQLF